MVDLILAGALAVAATVGSAAVLDVGPTGCALVVVAALALAVRRRWPLVTLAVSTLATAGYLALGHPYGPILVVFMVAVYSGAQYLWAMPGVLALMLVHLVTSQREFGWLGAGPVIAWVVVPAAVGYTVRVRQEAARRDRAEAVRQRVDEERLRVAREVHDVVGNGLAAIKMQADVALHVMGRNPGHAEEALRGISRSSGQALDELRATLAEVVEPSAGLSALDDLRQRMADAGLDVRLDVSGDPPKPGPADLAGYRVVQESLTNVLRHSGIGRVDVGVRYRPSEVVISVVNPIKHLPAIDIGWGIAGMRARVEALGGELTAGPVEERFEVHARIPS